MGLIWVLIHELSIYLKFNNSAQVQIYLIICFVSTDTFSIVKVAVIYYTSEIPCFKSTICCTDEFGVNYTIASLSIPTVSSFIKSIFFHGHTYSILNETECTYHEWRNYFTASTTFPFLHQRNLEFSDYSRNINSPFRWFRILTVRVYPMFFHGNWIFQNSWL